MKKLIINFLPEWKIENAIKNWKFYLINVGGYICRDNNNLIITWENDNKPSVVHHIIDVCDDLLADEWVINGLLDEIRNLHNDMTIIFDYTTNYLEVK